MQALCIPGAPQLRALPRSVSCCAPGTVLKGVPNNLEFLRSLVEDPRFAAGDTTTKFLEDFHFSPRVMEVILPGAAVAHAQRVAAASDKCMFTLP